MSIKPLCVATEGYLDNTLAKASSGYVCTLEISFPQGGTHKPLSFRSLKNLDVRDRILREEEELIGIIAIIAKNII